MLNRIFRRDPKPALRCAVVTPIGPGHAQTYRECESSITAAWRTSHGPFSALDLLPIDDTAGSLGRSLARNHGVQKAAAAGAQWIFFLDADDVMLPDAFAHVADCVEGYDAVWGLISSRAFEASEHHLRLPQILSIDRIESLLVFDPFLTLQIGHFVRTRVALATPFDPELNAGEDFDYYLRVWQQFRCTKVPRSFFVARQGQRSHGPRGASAEQWGSAVRSRLVAERSRRGLDGSSADAIAIKNAAVRELQDFYRTRGLADATNYLSIARELPYRGLHRIEIPGADPFDMYSDNDDPACLSLAWTGEYRDAYSRLWQALSRSARVVLDIGAGTGFFALLAARTAGAEAKISCFEPLAENYQRLCRNIELNAITNVSASLLSADQESAAALIDRPHRDDARSSSYTRLPEKPEDAHQNDRIAAIHVGDVASLYGSQVDLVRIDLPGLESAVLAALQAIVATRRPDILLECPSGIAAHASERQLEALGYQLYVLDEEAGRIFSVNRLVNDDAREPRTCWLRARGEVGARAAIDEAGIDLG